MPHGPRRFLLLATIPPRDERPDAISLHLTRRSYAQLIDAAFDVLGRMPGVRLVVKPHPRSGDDPLLREAAARHPGLRVETVADAPLERLVTQADCILSCGSSAGVDAALSGRPVIHLIPLGSSEFLCQDAWGFAAVARSASELERAIAKLPQPRSTAFAPDPNVCGDFQQPAVEQIAQAVMELARAGKGDKYIFQASTARKTSRSPARKTLREAG